MAKILVTGGAGFIGSHLVDKLINLKHKVVVVDNLSSGKRMFINPAAKFYRLDIQSSKIKDIFRKERFDFVFHFAAQKDVRVSVNDPIFDAKVNILGSLNLLENCRKYNIKKLIFASTGGAIYGEAKVTPTPETYPPKPISPYGIAKLAIENYLYYYWQIFSLPYVSLRYANVYGPRQDPNGEAGVVAIFSKKILQKKQPIINGPGRQTRDYVFVTDAVAAAIKSLSKKIIGTYNIGTAKETSVNQLFRKLVEISKIQCPEKHGPPMPGEQQRSVLDYKKVKRRFGWQPRINLNKGLKITINWFKNNKI